MKPEQLLALHLEVQHACCWIVQSRDGGVQCGLYCGHQGEHLDYMPGSYLPPMLHPLDVLRIRWSHFGWLRCPFCARRAHEWNRTVPDWTVWYVAGEERVEKCSWWRFGPCGCEARELAW